MSVADVIRNPKDPMNWIGAAGDLVDVLVPCLGGVGEAVRMIGAMATVVEVSDDLYDENSNWVGAITDNYINIEKNVYVIEKI